MAVDGGPMFQWPDGRGRWTNVPVARWPWTVDLCDSGPMAVDGGPMSQWPDGRGRWTNVTVARWPWTVDLCSSDTKVITHQVYYLYSSAMASSKSTSR